MNKLLVLLVLLFTSNISYGQDYLHSCEYANRQTEQSALACNIFWEASSHTEGYVGRLAVGLVVMNRVYSTRFPDNVVGVVYQKAAMSWTKDGKSDRIPNTHLDRKVWEQCLSIADELLSIKHRNYKFFDFTMGAMWYHNTSVNPYWADPKYITARVNNHIFYWNDKKK